MSPGRVLQLELPFMNNMDEIAFWIHTKRAPCLFNVDSLLTKSPQGHGSKAKTRSVQSVELVPQLQKKNKRKLSMLDDISVSSEKQQNVYFQVSQKQYQKTDATSEQSESTGSDIDFNIKNSSVQQKSKRTKLHKNSLTTLHKKNKIVTSTPKVTSTLRRSLRRVQRCTPNDSHLDTSFEMFNADVVNGNNCKNKSSAAKGSARRKKSVEVLAGGDQDADNKKTILLNDIKKHVVDTQYEDMSDVSGFTANYIRSTKTSRKLRCKNSRNLIKEHRTLDKNKTLVVCVNKAVNTGPTKSGALNCSTDSSQNVVNLVTKTSDRVAKVNRGTSLLKFVDIKTTNSKESVSKDGGRQKAKNTNASLQSISGSRYPKRYQNTSTEVSSSAIDNHTAEKKRKASKNSSEFNHSDRKENPEAQYISRTRSGRSIGLTLRQQDNSVLVLSNSTEQVSSMASMNVATPSSADKTKKKRHTSRYVTAKKSLDKTGSLRKDSLREKSGFSACFSDSEDDNEPLKQRKFFRA